MEEYKPLDYKVERPISNKISNEKPKLFDFKINKWNIVFITIIVIQFVLLYNINNRLSSVEGAFKKELDKYEARMKKLEDGQKNKPDN